MWQNTAKQNLTILMIVKKAAVTNNMPQYSVFPSNCVYWKMDILTNVVEMVSSDYCLGVGGECMALRSILLLACIVSSC